MGVDRPRAIGSPNEDRIAESILDMELFRTNCDHVIYTASLRGKTAHWHVEFASRLVEPTPGLVQFSRRIGVFSRRCSVAGRSYAVIGATASSRCAWTSSLCAATAR